MHQVLYLCLAGQYNLRSVSSLLDIQPQDCVSDIQLFLMFYKR